MRRPINPASKCQPLSHRDHRRAGFTVIEILVAIVLFTVLVLSVLATMTGLFGLTGRSNDQITATNLAQQVVEQIKGQWQTPAYYNEGCVSTLPTNAPTVKLQNEDAQGNLLGSEYVLVVKSTCGSASPAAALGPAMRLITVNVAQGKETASFKLEVAR